MVYFPLMSIPSQHGDGGGNPIGTNIQGDFVKVIRAATSTDSCIIINSCLGGDELNSSNDGIEKSKSKAAVSTQFLQLWFLHLLSNLEKFRIGEPCHIEQSPLGRL